MHKENNRTVVIIFAHSAIIFTILSQIHAIQSYARFVMFACWSVLLIYSLFAKRAFYVNRYIKTFAITLFFVLFHNIIASFVYSKFKISNYFEIALIPLFVFVTMFQVAGYITPEQFKRMLVTYCISAIAFAGYLNIDVIPSLNEWLSTQVYIYESKNSAAQIFMSAVMILLFYIKSDIRFYNILRIAGAIYLVFITAFLQCRTAILGLGCVLFFHFIIRSSVKKRAIFITLVILAVIIIVTNKTLFEIFEHTFGLDKYQDATVNDLSSGRLDLCKIAFERFAENPVFGKISYYVDCMYISVYTALGIFAGTAYLIPWFKRISRNFTALKFARNYKAQINLEQTVAYLTIFYIIESLLEGLPPFGPGATSAMFWLISAYMDYTYYKPPKGSFLPAEESLKNRLI